MRNECRRHILARHSVIGLLQVIAHPHFCFDCIILTPDRSLHLAVEIARLARMRLLHCTIWGLRKCMGADFNSLKSKPRGDPNTARKRSRSHQAATHCLLRL